VEEEDDFSAVGFVFCPPPSAGHLSQLRQLSLAVICAMAAETGTAHAPLGKLLLRQKLPRHSVLFAWR